MKRPSSSTTISSPQPDPTKKPKLKPDTNNHHRHQHHLESPPTNFSKLDGNLLYEVFKHADPKTLASASCVSKLWHHTALDERLWELICTRHWSTSGSHQRRALVLALGGFRLFYANILYKTKPSLSPPPPSVPSRVVVRGGSRKDEINLTLSLLSIRHFCSCLTLLESLLIEDVWRPTMEVMGWVYGQKRTYCKSSADACLGSDIMLMPIYEMALQHLKPSPNARHIGMPSSAFARSGLIPDIICY